jgi:hypothetical protein
MSDLKLTIEGESITLGQLRELLKRADKAGFPAGSKVEPGIHRVSIIAPVGRMLTRP